MEEGKFEGLRYLVKYPEGYCSDKKYPVILFLHGAGTRGRNMEKLVENPFFKLIEEHKDFPFVCLAPLCTENSWFDLFEGLKRFARWVSSLPFADAERVYLMGASMGGYAAWQLAMSEPMLFAAAVPISGGGMYWNAGRLKKLPVWAFHGGRDTTVLPIESKSMVDAVNRFGGNAKLTVYPENYHDAWSDTYKDPEVFAWLLSHKRQSNINKEDGYGSPEKFG